MKPDEFSALLAGLRAHLPMSAIAEQMGISRMHGYRLERGEVRRLSVDMVERVRRVEKNLPYVTHTLQKRV